MKAMGRVLLQRQWVGSTEQRKLGLSVRTSSPGWSARTSTMLRSPVLSFPARAAPASGAPSGSASLILPGLSAVDGGVKRRLVLASTGIRITTGRMSEDDLANSSAQPATRALRGHPHTSAKGSQGLGG